MKAELNNNLKSSPEMLDAIAKALPDLVFVIDEDGRHLEVLTSEDNLLYKPAGNIKGNLLHEIFPREKADKFLKVISKTIAEQQSKIIEYELVISNEQKYFEARTAYLNKLINNKRCVLWIARDITYRKKVESKLKESEARYKFLYNNTPVMMKAIDVDSHIISANDFYLKSLGYKREELLGRKSTEYLTQESQKKIAEELNPEFLKSGKILSTEMQMIRRNGEIFDAEIFAGAELDKDGNIIQILSFFIDRTDRKRAEELQKQNIYLQEELRGEKNFGEIIGSSKAMGKIFKSIKQVAKTDSTVLLLGETGTGKELIAQEIHNASGRRDRVLVKVNCGALPSGLVESELFGHEKGAFTGATAQKKGKFELADKGTIFLDEIGELPVETQVKLLRVLQEQEFERIGGNETIRVDVRIIAATNRDLEEEVRQGSFRHDLFYRLNIFPIKIPPLRDRNDDIPNLADYFVKKFAKRMGKKITDINVPALDKLKEYNWPGNVRELANVLERAVILCTGQVIQPEQIGKLTSSPAGATKFLTLEELERKHIIEALEKTNGVLGGANGAANLLGINRSTLWSRMQKLGINISKNLSIK